MARGKTDGGDACRWRTVWIVGGSTGIGQALARLFASKGCRVFVTARNADRLKAFTDSHPHMVPLAGDLSDYAVMRKLHHEIIQQEGWLDLALLTAAVYRPGLVHRTTEVDLMETFAVNTLGTIHLSGVIIDAMLQQGEGQIALVGSVVGYQGLPNAGIYGPSKAALINYCESVRAELIDRPVKIQIINPGFVETPMTAINDFPMPFIVTAEDAAQRIVKGLEGDRFEIAFPWKLVWMLKCMRALPYGLFFRLMGALVRGRVERDRHKRS